MLQTQMPSHTHAAAISVAIPVSTATGDVASPGSTAVLATAEGIDGARGAVSVTAYVAGGANTTLAPFNTTGTIGISGGNQPLPIRNPYLGTNFIIALQGIFPSRP